MLSSIRSSRRFIVGLGEVLIARIDSLEFGTIDGDACHVQQIKLAAQCHKGTADLANGLAVVLAEIRNGLEVRRQLSRQPDSVQCWHSRSAAVDGMRLRP